MRLGVALWSAAALSACAPVGEPWDPLRSTARIDPGEAVLGSREADGARPVRSVAPGSFHIGIAEVTADEYGFFLTERGAPAEAHPQMAFRDGRFAPRPECAGRPVAHVSFDDAVAYCAWASGRTGRRVRLPTEEEWEAAARGGMRGAPYPWGWSPPDRRVSFRTDGPGPARSGPVNPYGLYGLAGNVLEWCLPGGDAPPGSAPVRGGSWADTVDGALHVARRVFLPRDYRDADAGFRIVIEPTGSPNGGP
jgi:formylglycine-generating enzyme required for sulfatase activity